MNIGDSPPIAITLDQARALDALDRAGTLVAAAALLHKGHTAVMYALGQLEAQTRLTLLDRRGYRLRLTAAGRRLLEHARRLLGVEAELIAACHEMRTGWEPALRVVYDGVVPESPLLRAVGALIAERAPTRIHVSSAFLGGVEAEFASGDADLMVAVVPPHSRDALTATRLPPVIAHLVAARRHPLGRLRGAVSAEQLADHVLLTVRGGDPRLELPTDRLPRRVTVDLNDFHGKRAAIVAGIGYGWLPAHLCDADVRAGRLRVVRFVDGYTHRFAPRMYTRAGARPGPAARRLIEALTAE